MVMRQSLPTAFLAVGVVSTALLGPPQAPAFAAAAASSSSTSTAAPRIAAAAPVPAPAHAAASGRLVMKNTGSPAMTSTHARLCVFTTNGDYVHVSSSAFEASGHGWWVNGNCPTSKAVVKVQLQEF